MAQFGNRMFGGAVPGLLGGISDMMARYPALGGGMTRPAFNKKPPQMGGEAATFDPNMIAGMPNAHGPAFNKLPPGMPGGMPSDLSQAQNLPAFQQGGPTNYPGVSTPAVMPPSFGGGVIGYTPPPFSGTPDFSDSQPMPMPTPGNRPGMGWGAAGPRPMPPGGGQTNWKPPMGGGGMGAGMMPTRPGTAVRPPRIPINVLGTRGPMRSM